MEVVLNTPLVVTAHVILRNFGSTFCGKLLGIACLVMFLFCMFRDFMDWILNNTKSERCQRQIVRRLLTIIGDTPAPSDGWFKPPGAPAFLSDRAFKCKFE